MSYLVFGLGLLLAICGAASISFGYEIIDVERGWASVIGGAAALSGGIVTIALALILHSLSGLRALLKAEREARAGVARAPQAAEAHSIEAVRPQVAAAASQAAIAASIDDAGDAHDAVAPATIVAAPLLSGVNECADPGVAPVAQASIEDVRRVVAQTIRRQPPERRPEIGLEPARDGDTGAAPSRLATAPAETALRHRASAPFGLPRALDLKEIAPQHFGAVSASERTEAAPPPDRPAPRSDAGSAPPVSAQTRPQTSFSSGIPPRLNEDRANVIGRYESEGTTYVMFADGSIDARSELGAFRFSSMAELKAFMEAQTRGQS